MKAFLELNLSGSRRALALPATLAWALACGVVEHPNGAAPIINPMCDFGCPVGGSAGSGVAQPMAGTSTTAGTPAAAGGTPSTPTSGAPSTGGTLPGQAGSNPTGGGGVSSGVAGSASPSGGTSGMTITLGGVSVPKEKAIAFIHVGHSNMAGQGKTPKATCDYLNTTGPRAFMYHVGSSPELAYEPKTAGGPYAGPGTALVKDAATAAPDYYFVSLGYGKPSAYCSQFLPGALYYDDLIAGPKAIKDKVTFGGIFIYLGITERHGTAADVNGFPDCINKLVTAIRTDVGAPNLPALMNDYEVDGTGEFIVTGAVATAIRPQIAKVPSVVSNFALVSADDVGMQDDHHFSCDGQRTWVQRAFQTMKDKGWRFWAP